MTTSVVTLTTTWALVATGSAYISLGIDTYQAGASLPNDSTPSYKGAHFHIGTAAPATNTFAYHEVMDALNYVGTEKVYMRTASGTQVIKVSPIV